MSTIDIVLVSSLALLALVSLIFLAYMIPVLIQLAKTLEALKNLINTYKEYSQGLTKGLENASENLKRAGEQAKNIGLGIAAGVIKFFRKK